MVRLLASVVVFGLALQAHAADEKPIQPDETKVIPPSESAHFSGTAYPIPLSDLRPFDKTKHGWKCTMLGSDGFTVTTPPRRKNPVMQGVTTKIGHTVDIWVTENQLFVKYAYFGLPIGHLIITEDHDFLSGIVHLKEAVRGSSTAALDLKTGLLHLTMVMWGTKDRNASTTSSLYVCR